MDYLKFGKAICYSGYRKGQQPEGEIPTVEQIAEDLKILVNDGYDYLRMYDPNLHARRVLEAIRDNNLPLKCLIGIDSFSEVNNPDCPWDKQNYPQETLDANARRNDGEVEKLIDLVKEFPDEILAVSVGNENTPFWGARIVSEDRLIRHVKRFKEALDKPVTFCEGVFEWPRLSKLAAEVDFISVHTYPYHYGTPIAEAVEINKQHYKEIADMYPGKQIIITELGWSTNNTTDAYWATIGEDRVELTPAPGEPKRCSIENAKRYIDDVNKWIEEDRVIVFIFEAFDELWKGSCPETSECNFGLYNEERQKKF